MKKQYNIKEHFEEKKLSIILSLWNNYFDFDAYFFQTYTCFYSYNSSIQFGLLFFPDALS